MAFLPAIPALLASAFSTSATVGASAAAASTASAAAAGAAAGTAIETASIPLAASLPGWVSTAATVGSLASGAVGAYGAIKSGQAQANAAKFNVQVASENAQQAQQNANIAGQAGAEQAGMSSMKSRAAVGELVANQAASNISVNSGSSLAARESEQLLGEQDALTIRSNATRQAFGYETQATSFGEESKLASYEAGQDITGGEISGTGTLLGGVSSAASKYVQFRLQSGGFTG